MNVLTRGELRTLMQHETKPCVSLFLPTHRSGRDQEQDAIRYKNLLRQAEEALVDADMRRPEAEAFLKSAADLQFNALFWRDRSDGLAVFCADGFSRAYQIPLTLPELAVVGERFHIAPLLPMLQGNGHFYILALTQNSVSLYEATRYAIREVVLPELAPVENEVDDGALQARTYGPPVVGRARSEEAMFHGHGGMEDRRKKEAMRYFQRVDRVVCQALREEQAPLVVAGVDYLTPIYESVNHYPRLVHANVSGNPATWSDTQLREQGWQAVEPELNRAQQQAIAAYHKSVGSGQSSDDVREVVLAAEQGRVDKLFVARDRQTWGHVDTELLAVHVSPAESRQGEDLLDRAAVQTLAHGGEVYAVEQVPGEKSPIAALFRYAAESPAASSGG